MKTLSQHITESFINEDAQFPWKFAKVLKETMSGKVSEIYNGSVSSLDELIKVAELPKRYAKDEITDNYDIEHAKIEHANMSKRQRIHAYVSTKHIKMNDSEIVKAASQIYIDNS